MKIKILILTFFCAFFQSYGQNTINDNIFIKYKEAVAFYNPFLPFELDYNYNEYYPNFQNTTIYSLNIDSTLINNNYELYVKDHCEKFTKHQEIFFYEDGIIKELFDYDSNGGKNGYLSKIIHDTLKIEYYLSYPKLTSIDYCILNNNKLPLLFIRGKDTISYNYNSDGFIESIKVKNKELLNFYKEKRNNHTYISIKNGNDFERELVYDSLNRIEVLKIYLRQDWIQENHYYYDYNELKKFIVFMNFENELEWDLDKTYYYIGHHLRTIVTTEISDHMITNYFIDDGVEYSYSITLRKNQYPIKKYFRQALK